MNILNQEIRNVPLAEIQEHPNNARRGDMGAIQSSVDENGFWGTIVVQKSTGFIVAGNHRYRAAKEAGFKEVPVAFVDVDDTKAKKILAADNRTSDLGDYDDEALAHLLDDLNADEHLAGTGYNVEDLDDLINGLSKTIDVSAFKRKPPQPKEETEPVPEPPKKPITKPGDIWQLGDHRVMCGDSTKVDDVARLMGDERAACLVTDPPYNLAGENDLRAASVRDSYADLKASEWDEAFNFADVEASILSVLAADASAYVFTSSHVAPAIWDFSKRAFDFHSWCVWSKPNPMPSLSKRHWTWNTELVCYATRGKHIFNFPDKGHAPSTWLIEKNRSNDLHPTQKPVAVMRHPIEHSTLAGDLVVDLFLGSGTTLIAATETDRRCYGVEMNPAYVDVIVSRWENFTGQKAVRS